MFQKIYIKWNEPRHIIWNNNSYIWNDVSYFIEIAEQIGGGGGGGQIIFKNINKQDAQEIKKTIPEKDLDFFITVVCKINGIDYKVRKARKMKPIVTAEEIQIAYDKAQEIKISIKR